jgi:hypothetical protein
MMRKCAIALALLSLATGTLMLLGAGMGRADDREGWRREQNSPVKLLKTIPVPVSAVNGTGGALYSFDISFVDQSTQTYYVADRSNKAVDVVDARTDSFLG